MKAFRTIALSLVAVATLCSSQVVSFAEEVKASVTHEGPVSAATENSFTVTYTVNHSSVAKESKGLDKIEVKLSDPSGKKGVKTKSADLEKGKEVSTYSATFTTYGYEAGEYNVVAKVYTYDNDKGYLPEVATDSFKITLCDADASITHMSPVTANIGTSVNWNYTITHASKVIRKQAKALMTLTIKDPSGKVIFNIDNDDLGQGYVSTNYSMTFPTKARAEGKYTVTAKVATVENGKTVKTVQDVSYITLKSNVTVDKTNIKSISRGKTYLTVKWNKNTKVNGYEIKYSTRSDMANAKTVTISKNSTTSKKISNLTKKTQYYVMMRSYKTVSGKKVYSAWSAKKAAKTK